MEQATSHFHGIRGEKGDDRLSGSKKIPTVLNLVPLSISGRDQFPVLGPDNRRVYKRDFRPIFTQFSLSFHPVCGKRVVDEKLPWPFLQRLSPLAEREF